MSRGNSFNLGAQPQPQAQQAPKVTTTYGTVNYPRPVTPPNVTTTYGTVNYQRPWMQAQTAAPVQQQSYMSSMMGMMDKNGGGGRGWAFDADPYMSKDGAGGRGSSPDADPFASKGLDWGGRGLFDPSMNGSAAAPQSAAASSLVPSANLNPQIPQWYYPYYSMLGNLNKKLVG